jgi:hypothetical protein
MQMFKKTSFLLVGLALLAPGCAVRVNAADPNPQLARDQHGQFLKSDLGFGVDARNPYFYDSFEAFPQGWPAWEAVQTGTTTGGDLWKGTDKQANFGSRALTYGETDVILKEAAFGKATLTTKDAISLATAKKPVAILFAGFVMTGQADDKTNVRLEASPDLGFTWTVLTPTGVAAASLDGPTKKPADEAKLWKRYEYSLSSYAGGTVRLRLSLEATAASRKLVYLDDLLVAEK